MSDPIIVSEWKQTGPTERVEKQWGYEELLDTFGDDDDGNVVTPLVHRCMRYESILDNMAMLIRRLVRANHENKQLKQRASDYLEREWPLSGSAILRTTDAEEGRDE